MQTSGSGRDTVGLGIGQGIPNIFLPFLTAQLNDLFQISALHTDGVLTAYM